MIFWYKQKIKLQFKNSRNRKRKFVQQRTQPDSRRLKTAGISSRSESRCRSRIE